MATITIKHDDGSVGEWTNVPRLAARDVDELLLRLDKESGWPMNYKATSAARKIAFYAPGQFSPLKDRADQRVKVLDFDEPTQSTTIQFPDGLRVIVDRTEIVYREAQD